MLYFVPRATIVMTLAIGILLATACSSSGPSAKSSLNKPAAEQGKKVANGPLPSGIISNLHKGIDVSHFSGAVDWPALGTAGFSFGVIKATEGDDLKDPSFDEFWSGIKKAGLVRGAYHFYVTEDDPLEQAKFFIQTVDLEPGDLVPIVDIETLGHDTQPELARRLKIWLDAVEQHFGVKPIIYTDWKFWNEHLTDDFGDYPLWVAEYEVEEPKLPEGWKDWHLWQWKGNATVPGVEKDADLSRVNPSGVDLSVLIFGL